MTEINQFSNLMNNRIKKLTGGMDYASKLLQNSKLSLKEMSLLFFTSPKFSM